MSPELAPRMLKFLGKPWREKKIILSSKAARVWTLRARLPSVRRVEPGFYFVIWNDAVRDSVGSGDFERAERKFVEAFLQPGMTVLDVGAYFGIYALTASVKVGKTGRVIAFEPSPHQRRKLRWHLIINACRNVQVEDIALSCYEGEDELFVPSKGAEGFSSLRSPEVATPVTPVRVKLMRLDTYLERERLELVDFIKVDIEGGELDFFKGAIGLLSRPPRPVILCELEDIRAQAWGHKAHDVETYLQGLGYTWFSLTNAGQLEAFRKEPDAQERNFVAVPPERMGQIKEKVENGNRS